MPLWNIYHNPELFSDTDKASFAEKIVTLYDILPSFYVGVLFHPIDARSFYVGGRPATNFVRISVDHIARQFPNDEIRSGWLKKASDVIKIFTSDRGIDWELHVDETPFNAWLIQGLRPPAPNSAAEKLWMTEGRPLPYDNGA